MVRRGTGKGDWVQGGGGKKKGKGKEKGEKEGKGQGKGKAEGEGEGGERARGKRQEARGARRQGRAEVGEPCRRSRMEKLPSRRGRALVRSRKGKLVEPGRSGGRGTVDGNKQRWGQIDSTRPHDAGTGTPRFRCRAGRGGVSLDNGRQPAPGGPDGYGAWTRGRRPRRRTPPVPVRAAPTAPEPHTPPAPVGGSAWPRPPDALVNSARPLGIPGSRDPMSLPPPLKLRAAPETWALHPALPCRRQPGGPEGRTDGMALHSTALQCTALLRALGKDHTPRKVPYPTEEEDVSRTRPRTPDPAPHHHGGRRCNVFGAVG
ncbi:hypothetical protein B2J93_73 [Marssonina coronariae]|uniref:Uncharacterized protein n=1 Tax=Diplocarpon coronariae TaxID=2795749 RepID=A0A218YSP4_9HELO|nr:hypothetical protein B2J93_73 [Marssonina coronariae]